MLSEILSNLTLVSGALSFPCDLSSTPNLKTTSHQYGYSDDSDVHQSGRRSADCSYQLTGGSGFVEHQRRQSCYPNHHKDRHLLKMCCFVRIDRECNHFKIYLPVVAEIVDEMSGQPH